MHENRISDKVFDYCRNGQSVTTELAKEPTRPPGEIAAKLYCSNSLAVIKPHPFPKNRSPATSEDIERARQCGNWGDTNPSELFLRAYHDVLCTLEHDPLSGMCSPSLMGSTGVAPVAVIGSLHDCTRHWSNVIARAKREVLFATNYWKSSDAATLITDALIELSRQAGQRGERVVVKMMYDRGNIRQFVNPHHSVKEADYTAELVKIPKPEQIPNIDLQVVNYHQPVLGTFHAKFMVVDREIACLTSNNIQDNDNLEMTSHLEGPIVDSVWDTFVITWHNAMTPPAPNAQSLASAKPTPTFEQESFRNLFTQNKDFRLPETGTAREALPDHLPGSPNYDVDIPGEIHRLHSMLSPKGGEMDVDVIARHLNQTTKQNTKPTAPANSHVDLNGTPLNFFPLMPSPPHARVPMAMVSRRPTGSPLHQAVYMPQNEAFLSLIRNAQRSVFIQTPDLNAEPLLEAITTAVRRGITVTAYLCCGYNDAGEMMPFQNGTNEMFAKRMYDELRQQKTPFTTPENATSTVTDSSKGPEPNQELLDRLRIFFYTAYDQTKPIHNSKKARSCHIKLMIVDDHVAIQGSGNQDTQSWYQSQECNVMIDSPDVCAAWREGIERNQNTARYGRSATDGCWRDTDGKIPDGSVGNKGGIGAALKGVGGLVKKAQGK